MSTVAGVGSDGFQAGSARLGGLVGFRVWLDTLTGARRKSMPTLLRMK